MKKIGISKMRYGKYAIRKRTISLLMIFPGIILSLILFIGCGLSPLADSDRKQGELIKITTTTGMITDIIKNIGGEHVQVTGLMGPGVDPHLYKASERDIRALADADMIFYNGLNLEGKLGAIFINMANRKPTIPVSDYIPKELLIELDESQGHYDPHIWLDVSLWMKVVEGIRDSLIEFDIENKLDYEQNAENYLQQLNELHQWSKEQIASIPEERRVLVTAHDAFGYFGRAYGIEVYGIQGISTESEASVKKINELVDFIIQRNIKAVFVESSVPQKNVAALLEGCRARGYQIQIGGELFSDALGADGTPEGTYIGMVQHNVNWIVQSLK